MTYIDINISNDDKFISLFFSLPNLWDGMVVAIGSNKNTLIFNDVLSSLLSKEVMQKNMGGQNIDELFSM
jgi:hypothetical protein